MRLWLSDHVARGGKADIQCRLWLRGRCSACSERVQRWEEEAVGGGAEGGAYTSSKPVTVRSWPEHGGAESTLQPRSHLLSLASLSEPDACSPIAQCSLINIHKLPSSPRLSGPAFSRLTPPKTWLGRSRGAPSWKCEEEGGWVRQCISRRRTANPFTATHSYRKEERESSLLPQEWSQGLTLSRFLSLIIPNNIVIIHI